MWTATRGGEGGTRVDALRAAGAAVGPGEWTTYGEISVVVFGHRGAARAVGRWLASAEGVPTAHRILRQGGQIAPGWGGGGDGPARCRDRLEAEGVGFSGRAADPTRRVAWEVLDDRLKNRAQGHTRG